jgi:hypothetical protein
MPSKQVPMTFWVDMTAPIPDLLRRLWYRRTQIATLGQAERDTAGSG